MLWAWHTTRSLVSVLWGTFPSSDTEVPHTPGMCSCLRHMWENAVGLLSGDAVSGFLVLVTPLLAGEPQMGSQSPRSGNHVLAVWLAHLLPVCTWSLRIVSVVNAGCNPNQVFSLNQASPECNRTDTDCAAPDWRGWVYGSCDQCLCPGCFGFIWNSGGRMVMSHLN